MAEEAGKEVGRGTQLHSWSAHFLCCLASPRPRLLPPSLPQSGDLCTCARKRLLRPRNSGRRMFLPSRRPSGDSMNEKRRHAHARTLKILTRCVVAGHSPLQVTAPTSLPRSQRERERGEGCMCALQKVKRASPRRRERPFAGREEGKDARSRFQSDRPATWTLHPATRLSWNCQVKLTNKNEKIRNCDKPRIMSCSSGHMRAQSP